MGVITNMNIDENSLYNFVLTESCHDKYFLDWFSIYFVMEKLSKLHLSQLGYIETKLYKSL